MERSHQNLGGCYGSESDRQPNRVLRREKQKFFGKSLIFDELSRLKLKGFWPIFQRVARIH